MRNNTWRNAIYLRLLAQSRRGELPKQLSYLAAGCLSLVGIKPVLQARNPPGLVTVFFGGALLIVVLVLSGPLLNALMPVLKTMGAAPPVTWPTVIVMALFYWRYVVGRTLLMALEAQTAPAPQQELMTEGAEAEPAQVNSEHKGQ